MLTIFILHLGPVSHHHVVYRQNSLSLLNLVLGLSFYLDSGLAHLPRSSTCCFNRARDTSGYQAPKHPTIPAQARRDHVLRTPYPPKDRKHKRLPAGS
ncbi:hypothetical protein DHEL01_v210194 [Diaporthe helianthi]|uniref:Uncharacterized protein n=1 Tax=Diaporthe helianthi TaxID=158607 RepID=A0A2P5HMC4_DIAHE|nr:hypothetical protein DHEL01_v210194 [Diaporthe helianthi]